MYVKRSELDRIVEEETRKRNPKELWTTINNDLKE
jgi:hypothetical protein